MATFTVQGFEVRSGEDNVVSATKSAQLQIVAPLGQATVDYRYVDGGGSSAEISLSDYNLLLDGLHLNDGVLPDRIELFDLSWSSHDSQAMSQVLNLAFSDRGEWRDCVFTVSGAPLPDLTDPDTTHHLLSEATFSLPDGAQKNNIYTLELGDMPGVAVAGVVQNMFDAERLAAQELDQFDFALNPDAEAADITSFDISARAEAVDHLGAKTPPHTEGEMEIDPDLFDAGTEMSGFDDLAG